MNIWLPEQPYQIANVNIHLSHADIICQLFNFILRLWHPQLHKMICCSNSCIRLQSIFYYWRWHPLARTIELAIPRMKIFLRRLFATCSEESYTSCEKNCRLTEMTPTSHQQLGRCFLYMHHLSDRFQQSTILPQNNTLIYYYAHINTKNGGIKQRY